MRYQGQERDKSLAMMTKKEEKAVGVSICWEKSASLQEEKVDSSCFKSQMSGNSQEALVPSLQFGGEPLGHSL